MNSDPIDTSEMLVIHDMLRKEFASLPLMVKGSPAGDSARAATVGAHVTLLLGILERHHLGEDDLVWPKLEERCPEDLALVATMEDQHSAIHAGVDTARSEVAAWMADPTETNRAALHTTLIRTEKILLAHLGQEEVEILPLVASTFSEEEFAQIGEHARSGLNQQQMTLALGMILDNVSDQRAEMMLSAMPPEARAGFEQFGRPAYAAYRAQLLATA